MSGGRSGWRPRPVPLTRADIRAYAYPSEDLRKKTAPLLMRTEALWRAWGGLEDLAEHIEQARMEEARP